MVRSYKNWLLLITKLIFISLVVLPLTVHSDVPSVISYAGQLFDDVGTPIGSPTPANVDLTFNIYEADNPTVSIWTETHTGVTVTNGLFGVGLGSVDGTLGNLSFDEPYLLGITIVGEASEMTPKLSLTSAPTALQSENTQGSSVLVDCKTVPGGGKIQAALDAGATTITIDGACDEAVSITRNGVTLIAEGTDVDGITGPSDDEPALKITGASQIAIQGLTITEISGSVDESCVQLLAGANVTFSGITVYDCPDIGVGVLLNSSAYFTGAASTIGSSPYALEITAGSSAALSNITIGNFSQEGIFVSENSFAYIGDEDAALGDVTITSSGAEAIVVEGSSHVGINNTQITNDGSGTSPAIRVEGNSSISLAGSDINTTTDWGVYLTGNSSLLAPSYEDPNTITAASTGIFAFMGSVNIGAGTVSVSSANGNAIEIHNNSTAVISDDAVIWGGNTTGYGVQCTSNAVLNQFNNPTISGAEGATNIGSSFCTYSTTSPNLDLDGDDSSGATVSGFAQTFTQGSGTVSIVDDDVVITDSDTTLGAATIFLINEQDDDVLAVTGSLPAGISSSILGNNITFISSAGASVADFILALEAITFNNTGTFNATPRIIEITVSDETDLLVHLAGNAVFSNTATTTITVLPGGA
jgi:hypothetical protein